LAFEALRSEVGGLGDAGLYFSPEDLGGIYTDEAYVGGALDLGRDLDRIPVYHAGDTHLLGVVVR
jgi:hypothetical protein